jgi:hypothetical protein
MVVVVLLAYAIGAAFLDVWDMCIDTIFQVLHRANIQDSLSYKTVVI